MEMDLRAALARAAIILAFIGGLTALGTALWLCIAVPVLVLLARRHRYAGSWWALYVLGLHAALAPVYRSLRATAGPGNLPSRLLALVYQVLTVAAGAEIPLGVTIGDGLLLGHTAGVVMNGLAVLGDNCIVGPGVVLGSDGRGGVPAIGKNVYIGANAVIAGPAIIGDHATIGAGATVINKQIPACALVVGNPGMIVKENYRRSYHNYAKEDGCE
jgi:serine O-acetyltransferase